MRRLALVCAALILVVLAFREGRRVLRARAPGPLPAATEEPTSAERERQGAGGHAERDASPMVPVVQVGADGSVLLDGRAVSLRALHGACAGGVMVALRIDAGASWFHAECVLGPLQKAGVRRVRFDLPGGPVETCFESDYWKQDARHLVGGHTAGVITVASYEVDEPDLPQRIAAEVARIESECRLRPLGEVVAVVQTEWPTFGEMSRGLRALHDAGVEIEFHFDGLDDELSDAAALPSPPEPPWGSTGHAQRCSCSAGFPAVDLPVATIAEGRSPHEEDDRVIVHLDRAGRIFWRTELSLDDLAVALRAAKDKYHLKMSQQGRTGLEEDDEGRTFSKLYVMVRADKEAPARQVGWVLHVLAEEGFYKVQYAVTAETATARSPCCVGSLAWWLTCFLPTGGARGSLVGAGKPVVNVYVDPSSYGVDATRGLDKPGLVEALRQRAAFLDSRTLDVGLHVARGVEWGRVVGAIDAAARTGIAKVDFADLPPPDAAARQAKPLPR